MDCQKWRDKSTHGNVQIEYCLLQMVQNLFYSLTCSQLLLVDGCNDFGHDPQVDPLGHGINSSWKTKQKQIMSLMLFTPTTIIPLNDLNQIYVNFDVNWEYWYLN